MEIKKKPAPKIQVIEHEPLAEQAKQERPLKKTDLRNLLAEIKQHPEVLKLIDKASLHHKKIREYKFTNFVQDFRKVMARTLKLLDSGVNFIVHKEETKDHARNEVVQDARSAILFGMWISIITFLVFGVWAGVAPLSSSSGAGGTVVVDSIRKTIEHREGGIVEAIYVKDGDHVKKGQELLRLSPIELQAAISGAEAQIASLSTQLGLVREQIVSYTALYEKGLLQKDRLVQAKVNEAQSSAELARQEANLIHFKDQMGRLVITSPIDGIVNQLSVHTIGGVVRQGGAPLMYIIPQDENLVIDAYVSPQDIDSVHVGLKAKVRITAFKSRSAAPLDGVVTYVSPDVEVPQGYQQQQPAYKVRIEIDKAQLNQISRLRNYELYPGMTASVNIVTGERTFLQYLMDPITSTFWHAFNEK